MSETNAKPRGEFAEVECRVLERSRRCVIDKLTNCGNGELIKVFDLPYRSVVEQTACSNVGIKRKCLNCNSLDIPFSFSVH